MESTPVIDIHCHLLPGVDDGARSMPETLSMARMAVADGTTELVVTPHLHVGVYDNFPHRVEPGFRFLQNKLHEEGIPLTLHLAAEVRLTPKILGWLREGTLPFYGAGRYFLLEFPHGEIPPGSPYLVELILKQGAIPILAHPERNRAIREHVDALRPFVELGCLTQLTSAALCGGFGHRAREAAEGILERDWCHFLASDGHGFHQRQPVLADGVRAAAAIIGAQRAQSLVGEHPARLLAGNVI